MKNYCPCICVFVLLSLIGTFSARAAVPKMLNEPDLAYLFAYATDENNNRNGLHFAWSLDGKEWHAIGPEFRYLGSDYGNWGSEKRMLSPWLVQDNDGLWHCLWRVNEREDVLAYTTSADLINWKPQSYQKTFKIAFSDKREHFFVNGKNVAGTTHKVRWNVIDGLIKNWQLSEYKQKQRAETTADDPIRFASLKTVKADIVVDASRAKTISDLLIGIFFEDINYAADGGIYAELVQNRGFEYALTDKNGQDPDWNSYKSWKLEGANASFTIDTLAPIHPNNKHYARLAIAQTGATFVNEGFDGIPVRAGAKYYFSLFSKIKEGKGGKLLVRLTDKNKKVIAEASVSAPSSSWKRQEVVLTAKETADTQLEIIPQAAGTYELDLISLFPQNTFKGRRNGLRADLAQCLADMKPAFIRFPGGCVAHGDGLHNMYRWKNTVGSLESRVPQRNIWNYHQSAGLGYYEYFLFCEDIGAEPLPVLPAGVPCQNSATGGAGQQGGIPICEMDDYIQEVLDLIEWANGGINTRWGKVRAEAGHPKPFGLKYVGIGNEDLISDVFEERFTMIFNAVKEKHPEITVIGTVGPFNEGSDYDAGWELATRLQVPMVDEHYYQTPGWFINNQDYYDRYDRSKSKVYLGEYAAHLPERPVNIETALAEALYLTAVERNGDVVSMTSYAPLLAKEGHTQWNPDLIYFNNTEVKPTVSYYVQKLYGNNAGDTYLPQRITLSEKSEAVRNRFAVSVVKDSHSGDIIVKMVNLLPVSVQAACTFEGVPLGEGEVAKTILQGRPDDKTAKPVESKVAVAEVRHPELPPYSFTLYRIPAARN